MGVPQNGVQSLERNSVTQSQQLPGQVEHSDSATQGTGVHMPSAYTVMGNPTPFMYDLVKMLAQLLTVSQMLLQAYHLREDRLQRKREECEKAGKTGARGPSLQ